MKLFTVSLTLCLSSLVIAQNLPAESVEQFAEYLPPAETNAAAPLVEDAGYRYKAVRRLRYRQRRDTPSVEYLPPVAGPSVEYLPPDGAETRVATDGYRYKTVRRLKLRRNRRQAPSVEYLPPVAQPSADCLPPLGAETRVADDGYRYKTVRRLRLRARHRREASELNSSPSADYLPPVVVHLTPKLSTAVGKVGYRYKTVRRLKVRRQRRETAAVGKAAVADIPEEPELKDAELTQDGYRYKTIRRLRYRHRL